MKKNILADRNKYSTVKLKQYRIFGNKKSCFGVNNFFGLTLALYIDAKIIIE